MTGENHRVDHHKGAASRDNADSQNKGDGEQSDILLVDEKEDEEGLLCSIMLVYYWHDMELFINSEEIPDDFTELKELYG